MRLMRLVTSRNQGDGGKSREGRSHCRRRAGWEPVAQPWVCIHSVPSAAWAPSARSQPPSSGRGSGSVPTPGTVPAGHCGPWPAKLRQTLRSSTWTQVRVRGAGQRGPRQGWRPSWRPILRGALERDCTECVREVGCWLSTPPPGVRLRCRLLGRHPPEPREVQG